jgi:hypothetical protein
MIRDERPPSGPKRGRGPREKRDCGSQKRQQGQQAEAMRRAAGLSWQEIILAPATAATPKDSEVEEIFRDTNADVWFCLDHHPDLTDWESKFLWSLVGYGRPLSQRQRAVLDRLVAKARFARERAA